jgi:hypothetical protein
VSRKLDGEMSVALTDQQEPSDQPGTSRSAADARRSPRLPASQLGESAKARLLPGGDVDVVNISATGLLVEGRARPAVGTVVSIRLQGSNVARLEGRIVRSRVSTIHRDGTLSYESAIEFDQPHALEEMLNEGPDLSDVDGEGDVYVLDASNEW